MPEALLEYGVDLVRWRQLIPRREGRSDFVLAQRLARLASAAGLILRF
jgi:hypothetical protein